MSARRSAALRAGGLREVAKKLSAQAALVWLLLALVLVPTLGRLHQVVHGNSLDRVQVGQAQMAPALQALQPLRVDVVEGTTSFMDAAKVTAAAATATATASTETETETETETATATAQATNTAHPPGHGVFDRLLGAHTAADCQLLDQLALGHALHAVGVALPPLVPALAPPVHQADAIGALAVAQFQARGPPRA